MQWIRDERAPTETLSLNPWSALVEAATFEQMRKGAADLAPDERLGLFSDKQAFFRSAR